MPKICNYQIKSFILIALATILPSNKEIIAGKYNKPLPPQYI